MDKLDRALALYAEQYVKEEVAYFLGLDVSGIEYNEQIKKRMLRYAFKRSRYEYKRYTVKVILVACLVAMSVAFTACVSIPKIREAIWGAVIEWYDDHISVKFEEITEQTGETTILPKTSKDQSSAEISEGTETSVVTEEAVAPPKTIEQRAYIANLPEKYYTKIILSTHLYTITNYYNETGDFKFTLTQNILDNISNYANAENCLTLHLVINNFPAILIEKTQQLGTYSLCWTDGTYVYTLYGQFNSIAEILSLAENTSLRKQ